MTKQKNILEEVMQASIFHLLEEQRSIVFFPLCDGTISNIDVTILISWDGEKAYFVHSNKGIVYDYPDEIAEDLNLPNELGLELSSYYNEKKAIPPKTITHLRKSFFTPEERGEYLQRIQK